MAKIKRLHARQILNSKSIPTTEVTLTTDNDLTVTAACPSGTSSGAHEAVELTDGDKSYYNGRSVLKVVDHINSTINSAVTGMDPTDQDGIDNKLLELDGTDNKSKLGSNAILPVSIATLKASALINNTPLYKYIENISSMGWDFSFPKPLVNLINGGLHATGNLDIQEFMIIPTNTHSIKKSIEQAVLVNTTLKSKLKEMGHQTLVGDEGGVSPKLNNNKEAFSLLKESILDSGFDDESIRMGLDAASNSFFENNSYSFKDISESTTYEELSDFYVDLIKEFNLLYIEDPFAEDDLDAWSRIMRNTDPTALITGDDLTVTNPKRLEMSIEKKLIRAMIVKPNQIGTITETLDVVRLAKKNNIKIAVSHRSGETNDDFIADFAIGVNADFVKFGAPVRGERISKYNRLMQIEEEMT